LANYYMDGKVYDEAKKWILKSKPDKIVKGVVEFKVTEIFSIAAKPEEAGKKLV
jgi:predicted pyridoxine 5'-phosphate oxidase superfamily flavin-nucleotide-binding protein